MITSIVGLSPNSIKSYLSVYAKIIRDCNNRSKGYGFVDMESSERGNIEATQILQQVRISLRLTHFEFPSL